MDDTSIRLIERSDSSELAPILAADRQEYVRWLPARPEEFYTVDGQEAVIGALLESYAKGLTWPGVIVCKEKVIGQVTLSSILRGPFQKAFIGYWISSDFQGRGHSHRAVGLAIEIAHSQLGLRRLEAHTQVANLASQAILQKNGFRSWGIAHEHFFADGAWRDEIFWERLLSE